ncbi:SAM-dependent methyltransferase [Acidihalobacter ferrooxydans]|uniref:SAM-dependent methyltransferase n=1 Tax=Acidihalobacter ferrooxydans TaxID=1765967 RepID=A0A1P8UL02_9GAMM|nr:cyclopropane-fatty-acyl-phospholipid synthase family protein [Acidihalobacter ferrooxydans]APZ44472.1 SAM-dependent methyltransferase [Acidihalobacter ferrooxydans]
MLEKMLSARIQLGSLTMRLPSGETRVFGHGEPAAEMIVHDNAALRRILRDPGLELGETYMEGGWEAGAGGLRTLIEVLMRNFAEAHPEGAERLTLPLIKLMQQSNRIGRSRRNVSHHYDLDEALFRTFLDDGMFYSCAYFPHEDMTLEDAQQAKCQLLMDKLRLQPGMRVLDIGSGWGGLAMYLAEHGGVEVDGVTLSTEQLRVAEDEAARRGLSDRVHFYLRDYREQEGVYDRIVSVGMFEHVGEPQFSTFFRKINSLLAPDGIAVLHTIGVTGVPGQTNAWVRRHIFPGGYVPSLSQITRKVEQIAGLAYTDVEVLRLHYAWTLAEWYRRFQAQRASIAERMGEKFCRMWEFYLATSEGSFLWWDLVVFHVQLTHGHGAVPVTRDYLCQPEA